MVESKLYSQIRLAPLLSYPNFRYDSGEGTLISIFDETRELMTQDKIIFKYFDNDSEESLNITLKMEFLLDFIFFIKDGSNSFFRGFRNYPRFYDNRIRDLIILLKQNPEFYGSQLPKYSIEQLREFIIRAIQFAKKNYSWFGGAWESYIIADIFGNNAMEEYKRKYGL